MKTWKVEKSYLNKSIVKCSCGITKTLSNKKMKSYKCKCVKKLKLKDDTKKLYREYRNSAKSRNLEFTISEPHFDFLTQLDCYYCGSPPTTRSFDSDFTGIDRINSSLGYIMDNVRPCCSICNKMKSVLTQEEFTSHCKKVVERSNYVENINKGNNYILITERFKLGEYISPVQLLESTIIDGFDINLVKYDLAKSMYDFPEDLKTTALHYNSIYKNKYFGINKIKSDKEVVKKVDDYFKLAKKDKRIVEIIVQNETRKRELREVKEERLASLRYSRDGDTYNISSDIPSLSFNDIMKGKTYDD